jgi:hypothetical protein
MLFDSAWKRERSVYGHVYDRHWVNLPTTASDNERLTSWNVGQMINHAQRPEDANVAYNEFTIRGNDDYASSGLDRNEWRHLMPYVPAYRSEHNTDDHTIRGIAIVTQTVLFKDLEVELLASYDTLIRVQ